MFFCNTCQISKANKDFYSYNSSRCKKCISIKTSAWLKRHPEVRHKSTRNYYERHREKIVEKKRAPGRVTEASLQQKHKRAEWRIEVLAHYSGGALVCNCCGEKETQFLCLDHINNGGAAHRRALGSRFYRKLMLSGYPNDPPLQVLCHNCNMAKGFYGKCPHTTREKLSA